MIHDHHAGYITWAEFERNQHLIADNANGKSYMGRGSIRRGEALLPGLFRCARCGRRLHIQYTGKGGNTQRYVCRGAFSAKAVRQLHRLRRHAGRPHRRPGSRWTGCSRSGSRPRWPRWKPRMSARATSASRSRTLFSRPNTRPPGHAANTTPSIPTIAWLPASWSGAGTRSWCNCAIWRCSSTDLDQTEQTPALSAEDRARLMTLGKDLAKAWNSPGASIETRKKIIRLLIKEIIVDVVGDTLALVIHWQGGDHTEMTVKKNKVGQTRWTVDADVVDLVRVLARQLPDNAIAAILNRSGKVTGHGASWTRTHVRGLRKHEWHSRLSRRRARRARRGHARRSRRNSEGEPSDGLPNGHQRRASQRSSSAPGRPG